MRFLLIAAFLGLTACSNGNTSDIAPDTVNSPKDSREDNEDKKRSEEPPKTTPSDPSTQGTSGTRLKARTYEGTDGSKQFVGWYDSERQENCDFTMASDGKVRCLPSESGGVGTFYKSGCTEPLSFHVRSSCTNPSTLRVPTDGCGYRYKVISITPYSGAVFTGSPALCTPATATAIQTYDFFSVGKEISPSSFVEATETHE